MKEEEKKLNKKEKLFALEYLTDPQMNAEKAAINAGYSLTVARKKAYSWVGKSGQNNKPHVAEFIEAKMRKIEQNFDEKIEEVTEIMERLLRISPMKIFEEMGWELKMDNLKKISPENRALIKNVIPTEWGVKLVLIDKEKIIELMGKRYGMWNVKEERKAIFVNIQTNGIEKYL